SMEIGKNEKIALVGHNGAGKSTLIKLLLRLYDPTEGKISLNGISLEDLKLKEYRDMFSVVFQDFKTISLPVAENVLMRPREEGDDEKIIQALKNSGAYERIMELPNGIDTMLTKEFDKDGAVLSVGQAQKVAIAHAFVKNAPFIILDEPSSALDPVAENEMYNNMMKAGEGKAMIFISHRLSSAVSADRIYMLEQGEIVESGTHAELMKLNGKYADMFRKQAKNYVDLEDGKESDNE
ncbi:MAG: ABC transporter ATP-binding protein, partial [Clostridia bacterium]|nr:ABC transporter ATP-binding protein [Clostridia bacterium]